MGPRNSKDDEPLDSYSGHSYRVKKQEDPRRHGSGHLDEHVITTYARISADLAKLRIYAILLELDPTLISGLEQKLEGARRRRSSNPNSTVLNLATRILIDIGEHSMRIDSPNLREILLEMKKLAEQYKDLARSYKGYDPGEEIS